MPLLFRSTTKIARRTRDVNWQVQSPPCPKALARCERSRSVGRRGRRAKASHNLASSSLAPGLPSRYLTPTGPTVVEMSRAELLSLFDEIAAILETESSPAEKLEQIEKVMFEPEDAGDESGADSEADDE